LTNAFIGMLTSTGVVSAASGTALTGGTISGTISIRDTLNDLTTITVTNTADLSAGHFNIVSAQQAVPVVILKEPTVTRTLQLNPAPGNSLPQTFGFYYNGSGSANPVVTILVNAAGQANARYDLNLLTSTEGKNGSGIDLGAVYAVGKAGLRNIVVAGDIRPGSANPVFFGLPANTPGGVQLPQDNVAVAVAGNLPAGSVVAQGVPALAFGSVAGIPATAASKNDAKAALGPGTSLAEATEAYSVFVGGGSVVQLLVTGPGNTFDNKSLLYTDQSAGNAPITATVTMAPSGPNSVVQAIDFTGESAALQTDQLITTALNNPAGSFGDLILGAPGGIVANITAARILGNIEAVRGGISSTIQTTGGDFGRAFTDANGTITGVTHVSTGGGGITSTGRLLSAGNLISQIIGSSGMNGIIAANGDIGVIQRDRSGNAVVGSGPDKALTRFGGLTVSGGLSGSIVALGNLFGDVTISGGLQGRIAVRGQAIAGLAPFRIGILGNVTISGGMDSSAALVSGGVIGDDGTGGVSNDTLGTHLSISGNDKGILAAEGDINLGSTGNLNQTGLFENVGSPTAPKYAGGANKAAIDAIFTKNNVTLTIPADLAAILADLAALTVNAQGNLSGTHP
jgi:hypothetical protein